MKLIEINASYINEDAIVKVDKVPILGTETYRYVICLNDGSTIEISSTDYASLISDYGE